MRRRFAFKLLFSIDTRVNMRCLKVKTYNNMHDTKGNKQVLLLQKLPTSYMTSILKLTLVLLIAYPAKIELGAEQVIEV
jgi:hypothetical protein